MSFRLRKTYLDLVTTEEQVLIAYRASLRWGRIAAPDRSAVWISWEGEHPLRLLLIDGRPMQQATITDEAITWESGAIRLEPMRTLRDRRLDEGPLRGLPRLLGLAPLRMLAARERKLLSRARFDGDEARPLPAIHEVVRFPPLR